MSTQHPDNVNPPEWLKGEVLAGDNEVTETFHAFQKLGCQEQMWDWEGKDVDPNVVRKLFVAYPEFFKENVIGRDVFLTYRISNPAVEQSDRKVFIEALESIPRCFDEAKSFYGEAAPAPIFEVILPFTTSATELLRVFSYYSNVIVGKERLKLHDGENLTIGDWVGSFEPKRIEIIPLLEDFASLSSVPEIIKPYIRAVKPPYLRVFLGRSDPALNYGLFPAVLLAKIALSQTDRVSKDEGIPLFPIIGAGSLPFRGHLSPDNIDGFVEEYTGMRTITIQSALKYDFEEGRVIELISRLNKELPKRSPNVMTPREEKTILRVAGALSKSYRQRIEQFADIINFLAKYVPRRRARKLHIGLFGYSREMGSIKLPRAIGFTAAMYSLGIPPELVGASALADLSEEEWDLLNRYYRNWKADCLYAGEFLCWENLNYLIGQEEILERVTMRFKLAHVIPDVMRDIHTLEEILGTNLGPKDLDHRKHENIANNILISIAKVGGDLQNYMAEAARIRKSLG